LRRYRYGTPRDRLAGLTAVCADGTIIASADAPDVAGQDLVTLFAGSYGSLGLITEATFRPRPPFQMSSGVWLPCADPEDAARLVEVVSDAWMAPSGIDLRWPSADKPIGLIVMIQGARQDVQARAARLYALAGRPARRHPAARAGSTHPITAASPRPLRGRCWPAVTGSTPS
jgi:glycolate oxidase FAD binding subunit